VPPLVEHARGRCRRTRFAQRVSLDRKHGFTIPDLKVRSDVKPAAENVVRFTPDRAGTFNFHCDLFCGSGHEGMAGTLVVVEQ
jgi:cytochrome c oxidase subunit II